MAARPRAFVLTGAFALAMLGLLAGCSSGSSSSNASPTSEAASPSATMSATASATASGTTTASTASETPPEVQNAAATDWVAANNGYANARVANQSSIDSSNIDTLGVSWARAVNAPAALAFGVLAANPVVLNGVVYMQDLDSNVYALDEATGKTIWAQNLDVATEGPDGVAVGYGHVYAATRTTMYALNIDTGEIDWQQKLVDSDTAGIDIQPVVFNGMVYTSTVPGTVEKFYAGGDSGIIYALDAQTGEVKWSFDTVDSKDIWGNPDINSGGGAWYPAAVDPKTGVTYWGTGNPGPWPGTDKYPSGTSRPGPNLYTNSLIALDGKSGELLWYNQVKPHDLFDHDLQISPILVDMQKGDQTVPGVVAAGKMGIVYGFDRKTGELLWQNAVGKHLNDQLDQLPAPGSDKIEVWPSLIGGVETPMAYADGVIYETNIDIPSKFDGSSYEVDLSTGKGQIYAIDVNDGKTLWKQDLTTGMPLGGATVVNDLVITATNDGTMYAFKRDTGEQVWKMKAPVGINAQPAVVGDTIVWPAGVPSKDQPPLIVALKLGATGDFAATQGTDVLGAGTGQGSTQSSSQNSSQGSNQGGTQSGGSQSGSQGSSQ